MAGKLKPLEGGFFGFSYTFGGRQSTTSTGTKNRREAEDVRATVQKTINLLNDATLTLPSGANLITFLKSGGKLQQKIVLEGTEKFSVIADEYLGVQKGKAQNSLATEKIHCGHLKRIFGLSAKIADIDAAALQKYCDKRSNDKYNGKKISSTTIRKELVTFNQVYSFALSRDYVSKSSPLLNDRGTRWNVSLEKPSESPKFFTLKEIEHKIKRGKFSESEIAKFYRGAFLDEDELDELCEHVRKNSTHKFLYSAVMFARYTAARRSEIARSHYEDFKFEKSVVVIRERKRKHSKSETYREVPLHPKLKEVMQDYFVDHQSQFTFPNYPRRKSTAHITGDELHFHLVNCLATNEKFRFNRWHNFRHSWISLMASKGVAIEQISKIVGHTETDITKQIYLHFFPAQKQAIISVLR